MTAPPLPDENVMKIRLVWKDVAGYYLGTKLLFAFNVGNPSPADLTNVANQVSSAYTANLAPLVAQGVQLTEIDVLDLTTTSGSSATISPGTGGGRTGTLLPIQCCLKMRYIIPRRYRGGKPGGYWPFGVQSDTLDQSHWTASFASTCAADLQTFINACKASPPPVIGTMTHVSLSYYHGFTNYVDPSGRNQNKPTYKAQATHDVITGYVGNQTMGSQRRRRTATTP